MTSDHRQSHGALDYNKAFAIGIALNIAYVLIETGFGLAIKSLALLADAGHNLSDVLSLLLAWAASYLSKVSPSRQRTYGYRRSSILAAFLNAIVLLVAIGAIAWEAIRRFSEPQAIPGGTVMAVATAGVFLNGATALLFMKGREHDINIRGAFLHMAADAGVSAGVVAAGFAIKLTAHQWIDPVVSLGIVLVVAIGTWGLLRDSVNLSLDAVPKGINPAAVKKYLSDLPGVSEVHDLHIWAMSTTENALTAHLIKPDGTLDDPLLDQIQTVLHEQFKIEHMTIQMECGERLCRQAPDKAV